MFFFDSRIPLYDFECIIFAAYGGLPTACRPKELVLLVYKMCPISNMQSCMYMYDNLVDIFCFIELTATYCHLFWTHYYFPIRHDTLQMGNNALFLFPGCSCAYTQIRCKLAEKKTKICNKEIQNVVAQLNTDKV